MQPAKADIERHRSEWNAFVKWATRATVAVAIVLALLWFFLA